MSDQELVNTLRKAQESVSNNIALSFLLALAAERISLLSKENVV